MPISRQIIDNRKQRVNNMKFKGSHTLEDMMKKGLLKAVGEKKGRYYEMSK